MKVVRVVNNVAPAGSVAIGRGTVWGNPFIVGADGERERVVAKFRKYAEWRLSVEPAWLEPLRGKDVACYCAPKACHGDVILELLEEEEEDPEFDVLAQDAEDDPEVQESLDTVETEPCRACNGKTHIAKVVPGCSDCGTAWGVHVPHFSTGMESRGCRVHCTCDLCF